MSRKIMVHQSLDAFVGDERIAEIEVDPDDVSDPLDAIALAYDEAGRTMRPGTHTISCGTDTRQVVVYPDDAESYRKD